MFKTLLFQLHWFFGITAGVVLAVMGLTGATMSFQDEMIRASTPALAKVAQQYQAGRRPRSLLELVPALQPAPDAQLSRLRIDPTGARLSSARFQGQQRDAYFDPFTGERFVEPKLMAFFELVEDIHRRLAGGERGKAVTGVCVILLVFFCLSGLYLRWPKRWWQWRSWLAVEWKRNGRSFLWSLHSVIGTWCMVVYLLIALTGMYWAHDWYRDGLVSLLGGPARTGQREVRGPAPPVDLALLQRTLAQQPGLQRAFLDLRFPGRGSSDITVRAQQLHPAHDRAFDTLQIDPRSGQVSEAARYGDLPLNRKLLGSILALHSGSFFGVPGRLIVMASSLCMSLFLVTGWMLYLDRRGKKRQIQRSRGGLPRRPVATGEGWLVGFASQSGFAEQLAWQAVGQLQAAGMSVQVQSLAQLKPETLGTSRQALFVVSTFGDGEPPDRARAFDKAMLEQLGKLPDLRYALLALGDRQYARFCGFATRVEHWLERQGARPLFPTIQVDNADAAALERWHRHLGDLTGIAAPADPESEQMRAWTLAQRVLLNPGSAGTPVWQISLRPPADVHWDAGDILSVQPRHPPARATALLSRAGLDPQTPTGVRQDVALAEALCTRELADWVLDDISDPQTWLASLPLLADRDYSIATAPQDGVVELVVRQVTRDDGGEGVGSHWLAQHLATGDSVMAKVRSNRGFHRVPDAPMVLIGNGTGIAGLRGLLRDAAHHAQPGHWLLFGERNAAHDHFFGVEVDGWQQCGHLAHLDLAFSRDGADKVYVQHLLQANPARLRDYVQGGAVIHVCGSAIGMAQAVDDVLRQILGSDAIDALLAQGRYRRDVY